jgi:hypothetical protein
VRPRSDLIVLLLLLTACTGGGDGGGQGDPPPPVVPGIDAVVELVAPPAEGAGKVPTFEWKPVSGAERYRLAVLDAKDRPIWSWEGSETTVALGGLTVERPAGEAGPVIAPGSSWLVAALDAEGHVLAVSVERPVSP